MRINFGTAVQRFGIPQGPSTRKKMRSRDRRPPTGTSRQQNPRHTKYHPKFCDLVIRLGRKGKSENEMAVACGVALCTFREWTKHSVEFKASVDFALSCSRAWWENESQEAVTRPRPHYKGDVLKFVMQARFRDEYGERIKVAGDEDAPLITRIERVIVKPKREA